MRARPGHRAPRHQAENLLIDKAGAVKIADFGIAKMLDVAAESPESAAAGPGSLPLGTPGYAAPEQTGGHADHRADIYSLGVVLYEMLTGERPKDRIEAPSRRVQVDVRIDEIVLRALEKAPELRFATAAEFRTQVEALTTITNGRPSAAPRRDCSSSARAPSARRRHSGRSTASSPSFRRGGSSSWTTASSVTRGSEERRSFRSWRSAM